jgi:uncharacterized protein (TIRG00374 family)
MTPRKLALRLIVSLAVSGVLIFFSLRKVDLAAVSLAIARADPRPLVGFVAILLVVHLVKTVRWWLLVLPLGQVGFRRINAASAVGLMLLALMPLRLGELARPLLISRPSLDGEQPLRRSAALASCVVERLVDSMAMCLLAIVSLRWLAAAGRTAELARHAAALGVLAFGGGCVALAFAFLARERAVRLLRRLLQPLSARFAERVARLVDGFITGLRLGSALNVLGFLALTVVYWSLLVVGFWMVAGAFSLPITLAMACAVLACQVVGSMIPAGPGMVGTSQLFIQLGVSIFIRGAFDAPDIAPRVAAYANTLWLLQFLQLLAVGLPFLIAGRVKLTGLFSSGEPESLVSEAA